jgi:hypothetical protein
MPRASLDISLVSGYEKISMELKLEGMVNFQYE